MEKKKKIIIIAGAAILAIAVIVLCFVLFGNKEAKNKKELEANLVKLGEAFYEDYYYPSQEKSQKDIKEYLAKFKTSGLRINLDNLSKISKTDKTLLDKMVNNKTKEKCDFSKTYITILPEEDYGKEDYKIEVKLVCGFSDEEATETEKETKTNETKKESENKTTETEKETKKAEETKTTTKKNN
jgi:hypothetical protein